LQIIIDMLTTRPLIGSSTNPRQSKERGELTNPRRWTGTSSSGCAWSERRRGRGGAAALGRRGGVGVVERMGRRRCLLAPSRRVRETGHARRGGESEARRRTGALRRRRGRERALPGGKERMGLVGYQTTGRLWPEAELHRQSGAGAVRLA
jgi:hypothetical protein